MNWNPIVGKTIKQVEVAEWADYDDEEGVREIVRFVFTDSTSFWVRVDAGDLERFYATLDCLGEFTSWNDLQKNGLDEDGHMVNGTQALRYQGTKQSTD